MKHWLPKAGAAVLAASLLAGCGSGSGGGSADDKTQSFKGRGPITLATGKDTSGVLPKVLDQWNSKHPKEKVRMIELSDSADEQRQRMIQNAELKSSDFTVLNMDVVWNAEFAANRWIMELPKDQLKTDQLLKPTVDAASYRGRMYSAPWSSDGGLLYYRKDLLKKADVEPPKTWDEMKAACKKVKKLPEAKDVSCYSGQFDKYEGLTVNFSEMINGAGGSVVDENGKPTVNTPEAKKGLKWFVDAYKDGTIPKKAITYKEEEGRQAFQKGKLLFHRQWAYQWSLANMKDGSSKVAGKFDVSPLPGMTGTGASSLGGHNLAISSTAKNKATALDFVKFMTNHENQKKKLALSSQPPTNAALYDDPAMVKKFPFLPTLKKSILSAKPRPRVVQYGDATAAIQEAAYGALTGKTSVDAALAKLQKDLAGVNKK
jgi:multiple sugar transport system substrate-binding protein